MSLKTLRSILALAVAGASFALTPAAAQTLVPVVGEPIPFQISVPDGWESEQEDDMLYVMGDDVILIVGATDLMAEQENELPVSEAEARRIFTNMIVQSDSLLLGMLDEGFAQGLDQEIKDPVRGIRQLAGERAGYLRGRIVADGEAGWVDVHLTMRDGIMYMLAFMGKGDDIESADPLMTRIRESFVLAEAPAQ